MKDINKVSPGYYHSRECNLEDFKKIVDQKLDIGSVPNAAEIQKNIPIYNIENPQNALQNDELKFELMAEWAWVLKESSGAIVLRNAYKDPAVIDEATKLYEDIADEKMKNGGGADHFAAAGATIEYGILYKNCVKVHQMSI